MADINFNKLTVRNFQSIGNAEEEIILNTNLLTLVLGENLDSGGENSRNGVGKSSFIGAWYFALTGNGLSAVKKDNLVNSINQKNLEVTLEFTKFGKKYKIERGRKPAYLRFYVDDGIVNNQESDEAQGENKHTQEEIDKLIGITPELLKQVLVLTTESVHILEMRPAEQRPIIEELLGITTLSNRADTLKELMKNTKEMIKEEEIRIKTVIDNNTRINKMIADLELKSSIFEDKKVKTTQQLGNTISELQKVDIVKELAYHDTIADINLLDSEIKKFTKEKQKLTNSINANVVAANKLEENLNSLSKDECPMCKQSMHDHNTLHDSFNSQLLGIITEVEQYQAELVVVENELSALLVARSQLKIPTVTYSNKTDALQHQFMLQSLSESMLKESETINPYTSQITALSETGLQSVSKVTLEEYQNLFTHQEFVYKLLTNKDSFIRKQIIQSNITQINNRINFYLKKLMLPHEVAFSNDLTVEITLLGRDYDYPQLSRGERTRVKIATSLAFRDVWEDHNCSINLLFVDEVLDSGLDVSGSEAALNILKAKIRDEQKSCYLISHKEELIGRVGSVLMVRKENQFTSFLTR